MKKQFLLGMVFIGVFGFVLQVFGAQSSISPYTSPLQSNKNVAGKNNLNSVRDDANTDIQALRTAQQTMNAELYTRLYEKEVKAVVQTSAPADTTIDWYDTDQEPGVLILKRHNGTTWVRASSHGVQYLSNCASIAAGMCVDTDDGKLYYYNGTAVVEAGTGGSGATAIDDLTDVDTTGKATGKILKFDASGNLVVGDDSTGSGSVPSGTVNGQVLLWATNQWVASTAPWISASDIVTTVGETGSDTKVPSEQAVREIFNTLPPIVFGTGIAVAEDTPSSGTDTVSIDADTTPADGSAKPITSNAVFDALAGKQATLVSGTNIKTINSTSLLGSGNITITGGTGGGLTSTLSSAPYSNVACTSDGVYNHTVYKCVDNGSGTGYFTEYVATTAYSNVSQTTHSLTITPSGFTGADKFTYNSTDYTTQQSFSGLSADAAFTVTADTGRTISCTGTGLTDNTGGSYTANTDTANVSATCTSSESSSSYTDNFNRANVNPIGAPWTKPASIASAGNIGIYSQAIYGASVSAMAYYNQTVSDNQYSQIHLPQDMIPAYGMGAGVRMSANGGYMCFRDGSSSVKIEKWASGTWVGEIGSHVATPNFTGGADLRFEAAGSNLTCKVGGVTVRTATDADLSSGYPGVYANNNTDTMDDWYGGNL